MVQAPGLLELPP